ncbi:hypothetical protein D3C81_1599260 [compost metagenome]
MDLEAALGADQGVGQVGAVVLEAFLAELAHVLRTADGDVDAVVAQHPKARNRAHGARLWAGGNRLAADQPLYPQATHVVVVVGVVEGVLVVAFLRVDGDDVRAFFGPLAQPGVVLAVVEHVAFLPDEGGDFVQ